MTRTLLTLLALTMGLALVLPPSITAQNDEGAVADEAGAKEEKTEYRGPLPFYFGKLGLDDAQKEKLYAIDEDYESKIEAIEKEIQKLKDEREAKMETMLTPGQKLRLKELRAAAAKKDAQQAKSNATPAPEN